MPYPAAYWWISPGRVRLEELADRCAKVAAQIKQRVAG